MEDAWGKRILDKMSEDNAIDTVRIYAMLEDIVYIDENGAYAVLVSYSSNYFEDIESIEETLAFEEDISDKKVVIWKIDKQTTNPYRLYQNLEKED